MKKKTLSGLIIAILIPLAVGALSSLLSGNMEAFQSLNKPAISPPGFLFPIVWTILYILMGISSYIIYASDDPRKQKALKTYAIQLFFNFLWSIIFFRFSLLLGALFCLIILTILVVVMIVQFLQIDRLAGKLQIPYLLWCLFACLLNFRFYQLN